MQDEKFCRVTLRDARVPASALVGRPGQGWELLEDALAIERTGIDHAARAFAWLRPLIDELGHASPQDERLPVLGRLAMRTEVALCLSRSVASASGSASVATVATAKCVASEIARDVGTQTFLHVTPDSGGDRDLSSAAREAPGLTLSAGTTEMMRELFLSQVRHGDPGPLDLAAHPADKAFHDAATACVATVLHGRRRPIPDHRPDPARAHPRVGQQRQHWHVARAQASVELVRHDLNERLDFGVGEGPHARRARQVVHPLREHPHEAGGGVHDAAGATSVPVDVSAGSTPAVSAIAARTCLRTVAGVDIVTPDPGPQGSRSR